MLRAFIRLLKRYSASDYRAFGCCLILGHRASRPVPLLEVSNQARERLYNLTICTRCGRIQLLPYAHPVDRLIGRCMDKVLNRS